MLSNQADAQAHAAASIPPHQWAVEATAEEVQDLAPFNTYLRYRSHTVDNKGDLTRDIIESRDGAVARLISKEGRALKPEEDQAEQQRLQAMLDNPAIFARHVRNEQANKKQAIEVIRLIPDAMIFTYTAGQPQVAGTQGSEQGSVQIVLDFHPNPDWSPPSLASETLTGLEGRLWIDPQSHHVTRLEANVFRPVNVGFGVFAKLFPGGTVTLDEMRPVEHRWLPSHFVEHVTLRALMLKTIKENTDAENSNYTQIEPMTYQQAIKLLLATPLPH